MVTPEAKRRLFWICCVFLLFFRAKWAFSPEWTTDDGCYLTYLYRWIGATPAGTCGFIPNSMAWGAPLTWLGPALIGRGFELLSGVPAGEWVLPLVALTSMALWGAGFAFLDAAVGTFPASELPRGRRSFRSLALALAVPALYYSVHRAMMSHSAEFALSMALLYFVRAGKARAALGAALLLSLARYNDAPAMLVALGAFLDAGPPRAMSPRRRWALVAGLAALVAVSAWLAFVRGYQRFTIFDLFSDYSWAGVVDVLAGGNFGLLWTALPWLASLALGVAYFRRLSWAGRAAWCWMAGEALLVGGWIGNGSDFGYRYLIGSYAASYLIGFELLPRLPELGRRALAWGVALEAAFLTFLLVVFKSLPGSGMGDITNGGRGSPVIPHLLGVPFEPKFFKVVLVQQFPLVTIWISLFRSDRPGYSFYSVHGPALIMLCVVTAAAFAWIGRALYSDGFTC